MNRTMMARAFLASAMILNFACGPFGSEKPPDTAEVAVAKKPTCTTPAPEKITIAENDTASPDPIFLCRDYYNGKTKDERPKVHWFQKKKKGGSSKDKWKVEFKNGSPCEGGGKHFEGLVDVDSPNYCHVTANCAGGGGNCEFKYWANGVDPEIVIEEGTELPPPFDLNKKKSKK